MWLPSGWIRKPVPGFRLLLLNWHLRDKCQMEGSV